MLQFIYGLVLWFIVPCIIFGMLIFAMVVSSHADEKRSAWAGFFLGLIVFVLYIISKLSSLQGIDFTFNSFPNFGFGSWVILILGVIGGFFLLTVVALLKPTRGIGIVTLILTVASTYALFTYIFIADVRDAAMFFALGTLCGLLIHVMFFPETLPKIFQ
ncbi:MAG TPA: hypothetical protein VKV37_09885 [Ktedonobacteraceae bacterium]|nr:hypothetical protein [Ktedonobacteraceae bacterium]